MLEKAQGSPLSSLLWSAAEVAAQVLPVCRARCCKAAGCQAGAGGAAAPRGLFQCFGLKAGIRQAWKLVWDTPALLPPFTRQAVQHRSSISAPKPGHTDSFCGAEPRSQAVAGGEADGATHTVLPRAPLPPNGLWMNTLWSHLEMGT